MRDYLPYLETLRRVPDDVILAMATREFKMGDPESCVCGWVIRETMARAFGKSADDIDVTWAHTGRLCADRFGGSLEEWGYIYWGASGSGAPHIERAFVERVLECVGGDE